MAGTSGPAAASGPLKGVKVLDLTRYQNGPHATVMMSDYGADVIKLEHTVVGDPGRNNRLGDGFQWYHEAFNRGKRSITLNLTRPESKPIFTKLLQWADVLTENFRPGYLDSLGFGYDEVRKMNPSLIYASNSGFGENGAWAKRGSFDVICQGFSGMAVAQGGGRDHKPMFVENCIADQVGAMNFAYGIVAALFARERNGGRGQHLVTSQLGACVSLQAFWLQPYLHAGFQRNDGNPPWEGSPSLMLCKGSDLWFAVAPTEPKYWPGVCAVLERSDLLEDPRSKDVSARFKNAAWLRSEFDREFEKRPRAEWVDRFLKHDIPVGPCNDYKDLAAEPQLWDNKYLVKVQHPKWGEQTYVGCPVQFSETATQVQGPAPRHGEHTGSVLRSLGVTDDEMSQLVAAKAITVPAQKSKL